MSDYWCEKLSCSKYPCAAVEAAISTAETPEFCVLCGAEIERDKRGRVELHVRRFINGLGMRWMHADCLCDVLRPTGTNTEASEEPLCPPEGKGGPPERLPGCVPDGYREAHGWLVKTARAPSATATAAITALVEPSSGGPGQSRPRAVGPETKS